MSDLDTLKREALIALADVHDVALPCDQHTSCIRLVIKRHGHDIPEELQA